MNSRRTIAALSVAVCISGLFTYWLSRNMSKSHVVSASTSLHYIGTTRDMEAGEKLKASDLMTVDWPDSNPLPGSYTKQSDLEGRSLMYPSSKGQPLQQRQVSVGIGNGLSGRIPDGMRAISLKTDQVVGVAGYLLPGTHVDVLVTYHVPSSTGAVTSTVLQDAEILTAGQKMQPDPEGKANTVDVVTLLATPGDAERVVLASTQGTVHFVLRNDGDHDHRNEKPVEISALGQLSSEPKAPRSPVRSVSAPTAPKPYTVSTIRGDKQSIESFQ